MLEILATTLLVVPLQMAIQSFMALGVPKLQSIVLASRLAFLCISMPAGFYFFGLPGALWGSVVSQLLCAPIIIFFSGKHNFFDLRRELLSVPMLFVGMGGGKLLTFIIGNYH